MRFAINLLASRFAGKRQLSSTADVKLAEALEQFRYERETKLQATAHALERIKQKQTSGTPAKQIESALERLAAMKPNTSHATTPNSKEYHLDLSKLFERAHHVGPSQNRKQIRPEDMSLGQVLWTRFYEASQEIGVAVYIPESIVESLTSHRHMWRLKQISMETRTSLSLYKSQNQFMSNARFVGDEPRVMTAYNKLMHLCEYIQAYEKNVNWSSEVQWAENKTTKSLEDAIFMAEKLSCTFIKADANKQVRIWGRPESVAKANQALELQRDPDIYMSLFVNKKSANSNGNHNNSSGDDYSRYFQDDDDDQAVATEETESDMNRNLNIVRIKTYIDNDMMGVIIGAGGNTIKRLSKKSGASIQYKVNESSNNDQQQHFNRVKLIIIGSIEQVYLAWTDIKTRLEMYQKFLADIEWKEQISLRDQGELKRLIGKKFSGLKSLEQSTGVFIRLNDKGDPTLTVRLWGTDEEIAEAVKAIHAILRMSRQTKDSARKKQA